MQMLKKFWGPGTMYDLSTILAAITMAYSKKTGKRFPILYTSYLGKPLSDPEVGPHGNIGQCHMNFRVD